MKQAKRLFLSLVALFLCTLAYAQTEITGTVVDETGEGVIGATVKEKGTANGSVTDFDGNFKLTQLLRFLLVSLANQRFMFFRYVCCVLQILILLNGVGLYFNIE